MRLLADITYFLTIRPRLNRLRKLLPEAKIYPCGSRYVCSPPVMFTDIDFLVYCEDNLGTELILNGYAVSSKNEYLNGQGDIFFSWRKGPVNLIVTSSKAFMEAHIAATHICKTRNFQRKYSRILVYEALRGTFERAEVLKYLDRDLAVFLENANGPYGRAIIKAYIIQKGLEQ